MAGRCIREDASQGRDPGPGIVMTTYLLDQLIACSAERAPTRAALCSGTSVWNYTALASAVSAFASGIVELGIARQDRVAIYLEKRLETVVASFGATAAGAVFVPLNPLLKPEQVGYILRDCNVRMLITSSDRLALLSAMLAQCPDLRQVIVTDDPTPNVGAQAETPWCVLPVTSWPDLLKSPA